MVPETRPPHRLGPGVAGENLELKGRPREGVRERPGTGIGIGTGTGAGAGAGIETETATATAIASVLAIVLVCVVRPVLFILRIVSLQARATAATRTVARGTDGAAAGGSSLFLGPWVAPAMGIDAVSASAPAPAPVP